MRLFFALWPGPAATAGLAPWIARAAQQCGGRATRPDTLHLTLAFLGQADPRQVKALMDFTRAQRIAPGEILLDRYGAFPRQGVVWAGPAPEAPATRTLHALHDELWRGLAPLDWHPPAQVFRPHVTLARKADCASLPQPCEPVAWSYARYVLVASEPLEGRASYRILAGSA